MDAAHEEAKFRWLAQLNTAFKRRWFVLNRQSRTLTYAKAPGGNPCGTLMVVAADATLTAADDSEPELHLRCEGDSRVYILRGDNLEGWRRSIAGVS